MHHIIKNSGLAALFVCLSAFHARAYDFTFGYTNVFASNALQYVVGQTNIQRTDEGGGGDTYWKPINNGMPASLTQKFTFPRPTAQVFLAAHLSIFNFGSGTYGSGSLWASKDGTNWVSLLNAPTPAGIATNYTYATNLPNSLIGGTQIWIQARLQTTGLNNQAQFQRAYNGNPTQYPAFALDVTYAPSYAPSQITFVKAFTVDYQNLLIGSNYQAQASPDLVNWTNWGAAFTATSSTYTNSNYQRISDWNNLFFRVVQQ
jgi:hypothetical protein